MFIPFLSAQLSAPTSNNASNKIILTIIKEFSRNIYSFHKLSHFYQVKNKNSPTVFTKYRKTNHSWRRQLRDNAKCLDWIQKLFVPVYSLQCWQNESNYFGVTPAMLNLLSLHKSKFYTRSVKELFAYILIINKFCYYCNDAIYYNAVM